MAKIEPLHHFDKYFDFQSLPNVSFGIDFEIQI